jgi:hypothetical protein
MAGIFDMEGDDPRNYGLLQAGGALLTPQSQGGGLGAATAAFGRTVSAERQNQIDAQLKKLLIESRRRDMQDPHSNLPSDVRSTNAYLAGSPEWKAAYEIVTKQNKIFDVAGIKYTRDANGNVVQLTSTQEAALNAEILARAKSFGVESEKARFDTKETVDANRQPTFNTVEEILRAKGTLPGAPRLPNAVTAAPFNPVAHVAGPPGQRPITRTSPAGFPSGVTPTSGTDRLRVLQDELANARTPEDRAAIQREMAGQGGGLGGPRPASAGAAERAGESAAAKGTSELYNTMAAAAVDAAEGNRALAKVSKIIEQGKITGGPLATPEAAARNVLSEFGISLNKGIDSRNAMVSAVAANRLAAKIMKGGRSLTDTDVALIASAFPSFKSGIPFDQLPEFISMLKEMNDDSINVWKRHSGSMTPEMRRNYPGLIEDGAPTERKFRRLPD